MGETAADTRREIEETRSELDGTIQELRTRSAATGRRVIKGSAVAGGVAAAAGLTALTVVLVTKRRGGPITRAARKLPPAPRSSAVPYARTADRWMQRRSRRLQQQREEFIELLSKRVAEQQAEAERRANPLWRRTLAKALETGATVGLAAVIRRLVSDRRGDV